MEVAFTCSICRESVEKTRFNFGNNPEPFPFESGQKCCDDCNQRFVIPLRILAGRTADPVILSLLAKIAQLGRVFVGSQARLRDAAEIMAMKRGGGVAE
jgi:hypothetical protein